MHPTNLVALSHFFHMYDGGCFSVNRKAIIVTNTYCIKNSSVMGQLALEVCLPPNEYDLYQMR